MRILMLTFLLAAAGPVWAAPEDVQPSPGIAVVGDGLIVPGQRVGLVRLQMAMPQIIAAVGPSYRRDEFKTERIVLYEWRAEGIWVSLDLATRALRVISAFGANGKYRTDKGVRLMDSWTKAEGIYGKDYKRWEYRKEKITLIRYPDRGLQFGVVNDPGQPLLHGRIFQIGIFRPGSLPPVRPP